MFFLVHTEHAVKSRRKNETTVHFSDFVCVHNCNNHYALETFTAQKKCCLHVCYILLTYSILMLSLVCTTTEELSSNLGFQTS